MPELPEVEVTRLGISQHLVGKAVTGVSCPQRKVALDGPAPANWPGCSPASRSSRFNGAGNT